MFIKYAIHLITGLLVFSLLSCAVHDSFPFICFRKSCGGNAIDLKGFKKRVKGKLLASKRKRAKKQNPGKQEVMNTRPDEERADTLAVIYGRNIDYFRYVLLFRLKADSVVHDSLVIEHTSEYRTLIALDQVRLDHKLDTLRIRNIAMIYIKPFYTDQVNDSDHLACARLRAIKKYLRQAGVDEKRIKFQEITRSGN